MIIQNDVTDSETLSGVALIINRNLQPEKIDTIATKEVDAVWCQIRLNNKHIIVGSVYTRPTKDSKGLKELLNHIKQVHEYRTKHHYNSLLVYGDFNARNQEWGDHDCNPRGKMLEKFLEDEDFAVCSPFDYTFSCNKGGSVIDLVLVQGPISNKLGNQWIEKDCELFTGAPARGHYPVLQSIDVNSAKKVVKTKVFDWKSADWKSWQEDVETRIMQQDLNQEADRNGDMLWQNFLNIIQEANFKHVPQKVVSVHSKPFWNEQLSVLLKKFLEAKDSYKKRSTPVNKEKMVHHKDLFKKGLINAKNKWIKDKVEACNLKNSTQFWKRYKRIFGSNQERHIGNLENRNRILTADQDKEELLYKTYFTGEHLKGQAFDKVHNAQMSRDCKDALSDQSIDNEVLNGEITFIDIELAIRKQDSSNKSCD